MVNSPVEGKTFLIELEFGGTKIILFNGPHKFICSPESKMESKMSEIYWDYLKVSVFSEEGNYLADVTILDKAFVGYPYNSSTILNIIQNLLNVLPE